MTRAILWTLRRFAYVRALEADRAFKAETIDKIDADRNRLVAERGAAYRDLSAANARIVQLEKQLANQVKAIETLTDQRDVLGDTVADLRDRLARLDTKEGSS